MIRIEVCLELTFVFAGVDLGHDQCIMWQTNERKKKDKCKGQTVKF